MTDATLLATNNYATYPHTGADGVTVDPARVQHQQDHDALAHYTNEHSGNTDPHGDRHYADTAIAAAIAAAGTGGLSTAAVQALINVTQVKTVTDNSTLILGDAGTMVINNTDPGGGGLVTYVNDTFTATNGTVPTSLVQGQWGTGSSIAVQSNAALFTAPSAGGFSGGTAGMFSTNGTSGLQASDIDITFTFTMNGSGFPKIVARSSAQVENGSAYEVNLNNGSLAIKRLNSFTSYTLATSSFTGAVNGTQYIVRYQIIGNVHTVWIAAGTTLPGSPTVTVTDNATTFGGTLLTTGYAGIHWGSGSAGSLTMTVDNLVVTNGATGSTSGGPNWIVPKNSAVAFPVGTMIYGAQLGTQQVIIQPVDSSVTIRSAGGLHSARQQNSQWSIIKIGSDTWLLDGDLA